MSRAEQPSSEDTNGTTRIEQLRQLLEAPTGPLQDSALDDKTRRGVIELSQQLFRRAPFDYLERRSNKTMAQISRESYDFFERFIKDGSPFSVGIFQPADTERLETTVIQTVIWDRPFIIDSLTEFLQTYHLGHQIILHPMLPYQESYISLCYIEIDRVEDDQLREEIQQKIEAIFRDLVIVTDDFHEMKEMIRRESKALAASSQGMEASELAELLMWSCSGGFVLLGTELFSIEQSAPKIISARGLFCSVNTSTVHGMAGVQKNVELFAKDPEKRPFQFFKLDFESPMHRYVRLNAMLVRTVDNKILVVAGLFTSKTNSQEVSSIPLLRQKLREILIHEGLIPNSYQYKELVSFVDSLPKSLLFQANTASLRELITIFMGIQRRPEVRVSVTYDAFKTFANVVVVLPRSRFSGGVRVKLQRYIEEVFRAPQESAEYRLAVTEDPFVVLHFLVPLDGRETAPFDVGALEKRIVDLSLTWDDRLYLHLLERFDSQTTHKLVESYGESLPEQYKAATPIDVAVSDIEKLELLSEDNPLEISLTRHSRPSITKGQALYSLTLYKLGPSFSLSAILPFLENIGFRILNEHLTPLSAGDSHFAAVCNLEVGPKGNQAVDLVKAKTVLLPGLKSVLDGIAENDILNSLLLEPGLTYRQIALIRTVVSYLLQLRIFPSESGVLSAVTANPECASLLFEYFDVKFNPDLFSSPKERGQRLSDVEKRFFLTLKGVTRLLHDQILRALFNIIKASVRTNFYHNEQSLRLAIKIDCRVIHDMPSPRPLYEIFVTAPDFAGVHLRGGAVARGGIRWSERIEDFRTEVLGLMKTQMIKNAVIVPEGAKGGFILKSDFDDPQEKRDAIRHCYERFIFSLLSISDNRVNGELVHPNRSILYDEPDPYLVVAADKGTAAFSDTANEISVETFNFWLGDAFASGGKNGYDHKQLGITARGAWETTKRHFKEIGIDPETQPFTVVGIGDMSGDVFGNGLLLSKNARLIAAFNHIHIFVEPNPDTEKSYAERQRMFELPRSSWTDYNKDLISEGGGIYSRDEKEIHIHPKLQEALGITADVLSGQELIKAILMAPVDLLWNGGIGTYVKSAEEGNFHVDDRANDDVRINARELRARVFAEGGNLGITQRGRIEYAKIGGNINTDAVDNSGGVDMSDYEVNLKILLQAPLLAKTITEDERNKILASLKDIATEKVLERNRRQSLLLSLEVRRSRRAIDYYRGYLEHLENENILERGIEFLPDDETLEKRRVRKAGLTRPELAVITAYSKLITTKKILASNLLEQPLVSDFLISYFPKQLTERFSKEVREHALRNEIIATQVANDLVERMGVTFLYRATEETGAERSQVILAFLIADQIVQGTTLYEEAKYLDTVENHRVFLGVLLRISNALEAVTRRVLEHWKPESIAGDLITTYRDTFQHLLLNTNQVVSKLEQAHFKEQVAELVTTGADENFAKRVSALPYATAYLDIIDISLRVGQEDTKVAELYSSLASSLQIGRLVEQAHEIEGDSRWDALALRTTLVELRNNLALLAERVIVEEGESSLIALENYFSKRKEAIDRYRLSVQEFSSRVISLSALMVIANQLKALTKAPSSPSNSTIIE